MTAKKPAAPLSPAAECAPDSVTVSLPVETNDCGLPLVSDQDTLEDIDTRGIRGRIIVGG